MIFNSGLLLIAYGMTIVDPRTQDTNISLEVGIDCSYVGRRLVEIVEIVTLTYLDPSGNAVEMLRNWIEIGR